MSADWGPFQSPETAVKSRITIHHKGRSATLVERTPFGNQVSSIRNAQKHHFNAGMGDIGYNFIIIPQGNI